MLHGFGDPVWKQYSTSALAVISGLLVFLGIPTGPFPFSKSKFSLRTVPRLAKNRGVVLATLGYCGHMWELYGLWTWFLSIYTDFLEDNDEPGLGGGTTEFDRKRLASLVTFGVVGSAALSCIFVGWIADAKIGRCNACIVSMSISGYCSLVFGPACGAGLPQAFLIPLAVLWGGAAVAESAQFSAMATELSDADTVGTALTLQMALGFTVTVISIFSVAAVREASSWSVAKMSLAPGPLVGIVSMVALKCSSDASKIGNGKG